MTLQQAYETWVSTFPKNATEGPRTRVHQGGSSQFHTHEKFKDTSYVLPKNYDGDCDCQDGSASHHITKEFWVTDKKGQKLIRYATTRRPDAQVCKRENAWRDYISIRDGIDYHVR